MTNTIAVLGSTGSIGRQTLDVANQLGLRVAVLTAHTRVEQMEKQEEAGGNRFKIWKGIKKNERKADK